MDIEIIIKGGDELKMLYPLEYETFEKKIGEMIMDFFPIVNLYMFTSEECIFPANRKEAQDLIEKKKFREALTEAFKDPEIQDIIKQRCVALGIIPAES